MKKLVFIPFAILFFYWAIRFENKKQSEIDKIGLEDLNLQLTGLVDTVIEGSNYHGFGIIRLKIISSNITEYDPRSKKAYYYCVIKNGIAEIYDHTFISKVDTVFIDTKNRTMIYTEDGKKVINSSITINANDDYYQFIRRRTIFR